MSSAFEKVQKADLYLPPLTDVAEVLNSELTQFFEDVQVSVVDCPDLRKTPFNLPAPGISGNGIVLDIGHLSLQLPSQKLNKNLVDLLEIAKRIGYEKGHLFGAGGIYIEGVGNCQSIPIFYFDETGDITNRTRCANLKSDGKLHSFVSETTTKSSGVAHAFLSDGITGKVLKIVAKKRLKAENFTASLRQVLSSNYQGKPMSLGGVILIKSGQIEVHTVAADPPEKPIEDLKEYLSGFPRIQVEAPLTCLSVLNVNDPGLGVNPEHTHCFSDRVDASGHYEFDTTPETVEYEAYFTFAENLYRIGG